MAAHGHETVVASLLLWLTFSLAADDKCIRGQYNLTALHSFSPWYTVSDSSDGTFQISLCSKLPQNTTQGAHNCPDGTSVCLIYPNGTTLSYGNYTSDPLLQNSGGADSKSEGELLFNLKGQPCPTSAGEFYSTFFYFKCGKTLGHPYALGDLTCSVHIEWESYIFCKKLPVPENEVPCTVVKDGHLIDLSPLTKLSSGYMVEEDGNNDWRIFINVCRDITSVSSDGTNNCPKGAGSCKVAGNTTVDFGRPIKGLEATDIGVRLVYTAVEKPSTCLDIPTTTINFRCPERGGSQAPRLLSNFLVACSVEIMWLTEFACPVDRITSTTCQLTKEQHDINIDLSPLKREPYDPYVVNVTDGNDHYQYQINVCSVLGNNCGGDKQGSAVCQTKTDDEKFFHSVGESGSMTLRYSDSKLTMTMRNGDPCSSNYRRATMIEFFCNKTAADDGKGYPEFVEHSNCSYFFKWGTKFACPDHLLDDSCQVTADGKKFDLSPLVTKEGNWKVIVGDNEDDDQTYFLNVCHDIVNTGEASQCPSGSAVCRKGPTGAVSLGRHTQSPQYDAASKSLRLVYSGGSLVKETKEGCEAHTTINFYCAPGHTASAPLLVHKSQDGCYYEIEWQTSAACVLSHTTGDNCRVVDDVGGYVFDLNPLTQPSGSYAVQGSDGYNYLLNVCADVKDTNYCISPPHNNASVCQVKMNHPSDQIKVAEPTAVLEYFDGILNLTYTNGEPYNNPNHTLRTAEIAFLCDTAADKGRPEFLEEKNFTYAFLWRTSYACPTPPTECVVTDETTHRQYDLSSLSRSSQNWQVESGQDPKKKFYINVCRPIRPVAGVACSASTSVCATTVVNGTETLFHGNLGRPETAPVVETSIGGVKLVYTNGGDCKDSDGTTKHYQTTVHFSCLPGKVAGGPNPPELVSPCEYSILWQTDAACPVTETSGKMCQITDPHSNFVFNLMPLNKTEGYNVTSTDRSRTFKINICGGLPDSACGKFDGKDQTTVCELGHDGGTSLATFSSELKYSSQGEMTLTYPGHINRDAGGAKNEFVFHFFCDRTAQSPVITFDSQSFLATTFRVKTALACAPQPVSCSTQDSYGRQYDLSALAKDTDNWVVIDTRATHKNLAYHINVCRPVNPTSEVTCPGGAVGGCQTGGSRNFSMGYVQSEPVVSSVDGVVTIRYEGGDKCHVGKPEESYRSTRLIFFCDQVEHNPVFEGESSNCEYTIVWRTPSACPQQVITGSDCKVTDPLYNFQFDLSPLRRFSDNYNVSGNGYQFLLNVCGPLINAPGKCGTGGVSACQTGPGLLEPTHIGTSSDKPIYNSGQISLIYSEGKKDCHNNFTRSTIINFICDHSQTGNTHPQYVDEKSDCTYVFEWRTSVVCPPHQIVDCTYKYGDDVFDLSRLTRVDGNYERVYNDSQKAYIINVCRSLVHKKGQTCPFNAAACMIDLAETDIQKKFHNIGEVSSHSISYDRGTLILRYDNGEPCGKTTRSTIILFQCDTNTDALGTPSGHFTVNDCEDHFLWSSSAACPLKTVADANMTGFGNCRVTNPNTGYTFDLSSLRRATGYKTYDREGHEFTLNVCGGLDSSSPCTNGTGSCRVTQRGSNQATSAGQANARLLYRDGVLMLNYSQGEVCDTAKTTRMTYINFVCASGAGNGLPVFIDRSGDCLYYFDWHTQLACETEVKCEVTTDKGETLDLSPLVKKSGKYNVLLNADNQPPGMIYINLCRPLNPIFDNLCPAGSAACLVRNGQRPLSLGRVNAGPTWDSDSKNVRLVYTSGDPCPAYPQVNMTSFLVLSCGGDEQTAPLLDTVTSTCQYLFTWKTPLACPAEIPQPLTSNCSFYDQSTRMKYNLSPLSEQVDVISSHGGTFHIKVCGHLEDKGDKGVTSCSHSSVCLSGGGSRDGSYGNSSKGMFQKDTAFLTLKFSGGRTCRSGSGNGSGQAMSVIYFMCDRTAGQGRPELIDEEDECQATFRWKTDLVCPVEKKTCLFATPKALYDFSFLSLETGSWNVTDSDKNIYWLNLCQSVHGQPISSGCSDKAAVCRQTAEGVVRVLGQLDTQIVSLSEGSVPNITVEYSQGDADACNQGRRRRSDLSPKVIIKLFCGSTIGSPVVTKHRPEDCVFEFTWTTKVACQVGFKNEPVKEKNGVIFDDRTQLAFDLTPLISLGNIEHQVANTKYLVSLGGPVQLGRGISGCEGAAVCKLSLDSKSYKNLGNFSTKAYYLQDDRLEVVFTSGERCAGSHKHFNVSSTFRFSCAPGLTVTNPELVYNTSDCAYIFDWPTSLVCLHSLSSADQTHVIGTSQADSGSKSGAGRTKIVVGVSILLTIIVACVLILVLHKPERRAVIGTRLKSLVMCRKFEESPIIYSKLADNEDSILDPFNPFNEPDEESEINNSQLPVRPPTYRDDSDEDMLL